VENISTFFLTGFPGFIAGRLVRRLARDGARFLLLAQPAFAARAREDVKIIAAETHQPESNFRILEGDITQPDLGLRAEDLATVQTETTLLYHLAAIYDLAVAREPAMRVNVEGTKNVNDLALRMPRLVCYHYISTCYVAGQRAGLIRENELAHEAGFRNYYEETKYLAELEVEALKPHIPLIIHRPSVVCGDSRTGETAKYDGVYYLINYLRMFPAFFRLLNIGNNQVRVNLVPVDFVVEALAALATDERAFGHTLQLADPAPLTTAAIFDACARAIAGKTSAFSLPTPLMKRLLLLPTTEPLTGLPRAGAIYFYLEQTYDTQTATDLLTPHGVSCPRFDSYVKNLADFVAQHPKLP
jgi:thioester reductase-like protein